MSIKTQTLFPVPFANSAGATYRYTITQTNETDNANKATFDDGFPAVTMQPIEAGGIPMFGQDFNGILYQITSALREIQAGNPITYNSDFATSIGGYAINSIILGSDGKFYQAIKDSVTTDPVSDTTNWRQWLNFLPLTGGALIGDVTFSGQNKVLRFQNGVYVNNIRINGANQFCFSLYDSVSKTIKDRAIFYPDTNILSFQNLSSVTINGAAVLTTSGGAVAGNTNFTGKLQQAGNDVITTANVSNYQGLGYGQTWQDVTNDRTKGVIYQNTSGKPIQVCVDVSTTSGNRAVIYIGPTQESMITVGFGSTQAASQQSQIIPPDHYYKITESFNKWVELR